MAGAPLEWLAGRGAQRDVLDGLRDIAGDWQTLWTKCERGDWLLGIAIELGVEHVALVRAATASARVALDHVEGDLRAASVAALDAADAWASAASEDDAARTAVAAALVADRTRALDEATKRAVDPASDAAMRAALAVGLGVADPDVLASAPAAAAEATIMATMDCGLAMAMRWAHDKCATAVRAAIPWAAVDPLVEALGASSTSG